MLRSSFIILFMTCVLAACNKSNTPNQSDKAVVDAPLQVAAEDILTVQSNTLTSGPVVTGSIQPERKADLRAEVSAVVLQVLKENGEAVAKGDLLVRLDDAAIRDSMHSAEEAERAAAQTSDQSERQFQRQKSLRASGMVSTQTLEDAENRRNVALSDLVAAKARSAQARQQLQRTEVRAPFDGITSERKVSAGDTAQPGKELIKVIDPASMRLQGFVSADKVGNVKVGQPVNFHANGYGDQEFLGKVRRIDPAADATTRQVAVMVELVGKNQPKVSGLYAEGNIEAGNALALMIKNSALVREGDQAYAWRIKGGILNKVPVTLGERDPRHGDYVVLTGLVAGDKIIRSPMSTLKDGQKIVMTATAPSS